MFFSINIYLQYSAISVIFSLAKIALDVTIYGGAS